MTLPKSSTAPHLAGPVVRTRSVLRALDAARTRTVALLATRLILLDAHLRIAKRYPHHAASIVLDKDLKLLAPTRCAPRLVQRYFFASVFSHPSPGVVSARKLLVVQSRCLIP